jgi:hypothetical protein
MPSTPAHTGLKAKALEEFRVFWAIAIYLALMFSAFTWYRRFILSESGISYVHYGVAVIEALILAKVILVGQALRLGRQLEESRLIYSVLFKSVVFGVFVALFTVLEHVITGLVHHETWTHIVHQILSVGRDEALARSVILSVTFIPFFAWWEADRALGGGKLFALFFYKRTPERGGQP